ncbi:MAG: 6-phosphogluconolactonase [Clostridia bacterium]|nr:6-phosphogluconolactonase [Clostridia bacterium]
MKVKVFETAKEVGAAAAKQAAAKLNATIAEKGSARLLLSTGASQFTFFESFVKEDVDWSKVEMFHLDEYVGISDEHPASFNKYLRERFIDIVHPGKYHLISGQDDPEETIAKISALLSERKVDLGLIGIGENGHIAFNDPPADFDDARCYKVVNLSDTCIQQQLHEGWFENEDAAFKQAISMTCQKIMDCETIISVVPYKVKAQAIVDTLTKEKTNLVPATLLKEHADVTVYCDKASASLTDAATLAKFA